MKIRVLFIPLILLLACGSKQEKAVVSEEKMIEILVDVQLSETYFLNNDPTVRSKKINALPADYYKYIFEKHQITKAEFDESIQFYLDNLPTFKIIYDSVAVRLERLKASDEIKKVTN